MSSAETTNFTIRLDKQIKLDAEKLFHELGITLSGAINIFLHQSLLIQGLPFAVRKEQPNAKTLEAMREAMTLAHAPNAKTYATAEEVLQLEEK